VISATHRDTGKILRLTPRQLIDLEEVLCELRRKYSISGETYLPPSIPQVIRLLNLPLASDLIWISFIIVLIF
jgi:hypothetical protein